jgi:hypothetical protein
MKVIELSKGQVAVVDDESFMELAQYNWCISAVGYAVRRKKFPDGSVKVVYMHRELMCAQKGQEVDHINGNRLDNRRENLRLATRSQNAKNVGKKPSNKSGFKGVHKHGRNNSWVAQISVENKMIHLGSFKTPEEAALAYNAAAQRLHGEFANFN